MTEYQCPFCDDWILFTQFSQHQSQHTDSSRGNSVMLDGFHSRLEVPSTIEEMRRRFSPLGMYSER